MDLDLKNKLQDLLCRIENESNKTIPLPKDKQERLRQQGKQEAYSHIYFDLRKILDDQNIEPNKMEVKNTLPYYDFNFDLKKYTNPTLRYIHQNFTDQDASGLEYLIEKGLSKKGFVFATKIDLVNFFKKRCEVLDALHTKTYTFLVDDVPFLSYCYDAEINIEKSDNNGNLTFSAVAGKYKFL